MRPSQQKQNNIFTDEQLQNFAGFEIILRKVHNRLIREGYIIKDGKFMPPQKNKISQ